MNVRAIVPVQDFARAKTRLAPVLDASARSELAESLATHVVSMLRAHRDIEEVVVVTPSIEIRGWASSLGVASLLEDRNAQGLAEIIDAARGELPRTPVLIVMGDLPELSHEDLTAIIESAESADVVIGPDTAGRGTNALLLRVPMPTCFGHEDSAVRHRARATSLGFRVAWVERDGIGRDVDHPDDLRSMLVR